MTTTIGARLLNSEGNFSPRYLIPVLNEIGVILPSYDEGIHANGCGPLIY